MPDDPTPAPTPPQNTTGGGWSGIADRVLGLSTEQLRIFATIAFVGFLCWFVYDNTSAGRANDIERTAMMTRAIDSSADKSIQTMRELGDRYTSNQKEMVALTVGSHTKLATEIGKLQQSVVDLTTSNAELKKQIAELTLMMTELKKKLPPSEVYLAPQPRSVRVSGRRRSHRLQL